MLKVRLKDKITISFLIVSLLPLLICSLFILYFTILDFKKLEGINLKDKLNQAAALLQEKQNNLQKNTRDYAHRDEMYAGVNAPDSGWLGDNVTNWISKNFEIEWMLGVKNNGEIFYNYRTPPEYINTSLSKNFFEKIIKEKEFFGFIQTSSGLYNITVSPILHSDGSGPVNGYLLFGNLVDNNFLAGFKEVLGSDLAIFLYNKDIISTNQAFFNDVPLFSSVHFFANPKTDFYLTQIATNGIIVAPLADIYNQSFGNIIIAQDRVAFSVIEKQIILFSIISLIIASLLVFFISLFLNRAIRGPLVELGNSMKISNQGQWPGKVNITGNDEIGELAKSFNEMVDNSRTYEKNIINKNSDLKSEIVYRQLAEKKLELEKNKLAITLSSIGDGVIVVDNEQKIIYLNPAAEGITDWNIKEAAGLPLEEVLKIYDEKSGKKQNLPVREALNTGKTVNLANHVILRRKDEQLIPISDSAAPIFDSQKKVNGAVLVFRDVIKERIAETKIVNAKNQLEKLNSELDQKVEQKTNDLKKALEELKSLDALKDEFLNISAHELKTPLTSIIGLTGLILLNKQGLINIKQRKSLKIVNNESVRLLNIIKKILDITRLEAKKTIFNMQVVNPCDILPPVAESLKQIAKTIKVQIICSHPQKEIFVKADPERLKEVVYNLIDNALKFSPPKSKIFVSGKRDGKNFIFSVQDQGSGIDPVKKDKLFQKFSQLDTGFSRKQEGTGLGLYISKVIIENMKGKIWVESKPGQGSEFKFSLPLAKK